MLEDESDTSSVFLSYSQIILGEFYFVFLDLNLHLCPKYVHFVYFLLSVTSGVRRKMWFVFYYSFHIKLL